MRNSPAILALAATALIVGACSKPAPQQAANPAETAASSGETASVPTPAAAPAPGEPTAEQAKTLLASLPPAYAAADLDNGKRKFAQCATCHTLAQGAPNMTGPNLYGVFGRKAGSLAGYDYSDGVKAAAFSWDADHINTWITDPRAMIPNTKMTFMGLKDAKDRTDVIAYVKVQTTAVK